MKKNARTKKYFAPQNNGERCCDHPGCTKKGEYRAPKDRNLKDYYWFCLEHVQEYNSKWNYYDGIRTDAPEEEAPKRRMRFNNFSTKIKYNFGFGIDEDYNFFDEYDLDYAKSQSIYFSAKDKEYLRVMELSQEEFSLENLKKQYKKLVKKYHPDINQNDKLAEEKFKKLGEAYKALLSKLN